MAQRGCNKNAGPGPNKYLLPSTVGFRHHDATRDRKPAYSMGRRPEMEEKSIGPGPNRMVDKLSRFGSTKAPAYTMAPHLEPPAPFLTPGPGRYFPENYVERAPAFSLLKRLKPQEAFMTPAPNTYMLPSGLNGTFQHLGKRLEDTFKDCSPGPAKYGATQLDINRWRMPKYSLSDRTPLPHDRSDKPAPNEYMPTYNTHRSPPKFSFGVKHTDCEFTPLTDEDKYPPGCP